MAQLQTDFPTTRRRGNMKYKKTFPRIDMTPMVDLGFLLICFFVITTTMSEPKTSDLFMPKEGPPLLVKSSSVLTVMPSRDNRVFYYEGDFTVARINHAIYETNYSMIDGIGSVIRQKQKQLSSAKDRLLLIVKPCGVSTYQNLMNILDEILINNVKHYAVVEMMAEENAYINSVSR
jgi:biopolymer transport protein ExbD